jgi:hypothetical protein
MKRLVIKQDDDGCDNGPRDWDNVLPKQHI